MISADLNIDLSVIVPLYNEAANVTRLYKAIRDVMDGCQMTYQVIFVDDGSQDDTLQRLQTIVANDPRVRAVKLRKNFGQTPALAAGIDYAKGRILVTMDGDLQNDPRDIPRLVGLIENGYDLVTGWRKDRQDKTITRKIPSKLANWIIAKVTGVPIHDTGCALKAYRAELLKKVPLYSDLHRFIPAMSTLATNRFTEVVVRHHPRRYGKSKYGMLRVWRVVLDIITIKMLISYSRRPLHWFGLWAFLFVMLAAWAGGASIFLALATQSGSGLILPLVCCLMFFLALHCLVAGIFAELVIRADPSDTVQPLTQHVELSCRS